MFITRRSFLNWIGVVGLFTILREKVNAAAPVGSFSKFHDNGGAVLHDSTLCLGCRKCEEVCNLLNGFANPDKPFSDLTVLSTKRRTTSVSHTVVNEYKEYKFVNCNKKTKSYFYKKQCNHCLEPACASACFVSAFKKTIEGPVVYDSSVCVGCRYCMIACSFEIPTYEYDNAFSPKVMKCNMCYERVLEDLLPGCVDVCPSGALIFGKRSKLIEIARNRLSNKPENYINHIYGEYEMGGTGWLYLSAVDFNNLGMRTDLGVLAASHYTAPALGIVPVILGLWPVLLTGLYAINRRKDRVANDEKNRSINIVTSDIEERYKNKIDLILKEAEEDKKKTLKIEIKKALEKAGVNIDELITDEGNDNLK